MTGNRLVKIDFPLSKRFLYGTLAHSVFTVTGKNTILTIHDRCHQIALFIDIGNSLPFDNGLRFG